MGLQPDGTQLEGWNFIQEKVLSHDEDMIADENGDEYDGKEAYEDRYEYEDEDEEMGED